MIILIFIIFSKFTLSRNQKLYLSFIITVVNRFRMDVLYICIYIYNNSMFEFRNYISGLHKFCLSTLLFLSNDVCRLAFDWKENHNFYPGLHIHVSPSRTRAASLDIDRLRSLNSAINDCVHRLRGSRSNEYDERVAALGERAVHTDLRLIDWTPFHAPPRHDSRPLKSTLWVSQRRW